MGYGVEKNTVRALGYFYRSARAGEPVGIYNLGQAYLAGIGAPEDKAEAYKWFYIAADLGDEEAAQMLKTLKRQLKKEKVNTAEKRAKEWKKSVLGVDE